MFFFDPKTLNDTELFEKQLDLITKKLMAASVGKVDIANQLQVMIIAIEQERRERMFNERIGTYVRSSSPVVIETEVDLQDKAPAPEDTKKSTKEMRPIRRAVRTTTPVVPPNDERN